MLTEYSLDTARTLVSRMGQKGFDLKAVEDSPLHLLNNLTIGTKAILEASTQTTELPVVGLLDESKRQSLDGMFEHDEAMKLYVENGGKAITDIMSVARNGVMGDAKQVLEIYNELIDDVALEIKEPFNLIPNNYSNIWGLSQFSLIIERFENVAYKQVDIPSGFPEIDEYDLKQLLKFNIRSMDETLEKWIEDQTIEKLMNVYNRLFVSRTWDPSRPLNVLYKTDQGMERSDILAAYLISLNMVEVLVDKVDLPLAQLENLATNLMSTTGRNLNQILKRRESDVKLGTLIYNVTIEQDKYSKEGKRTVYVNGDVYDQFMKDEGSNGAIYGAILNGGGMSLKYIKENQSRLEDLYSKRKELHNQESSSLVFAAKKDVIKIAMSRFIAQSDDDNLPALKGRVQEVLALKVNELEPKDLVDVPVAIRDLVCTVLYPNSNAKAFLNAMDTAEVENGGLCSREYAFLSGIDLVARWLADQIKTKPMVR